MLMEKIKKFVKRAIIAGIIFVVLTTIMMFCFGLYNIHRANEKAEYAENKSVIQLSRIEEATGWEYSE